MKRKLGKGTEKIRREPLALEFGGVLLFDVTTLKMARKPVKLQKENPAGCAGEGKQSKGN